MKVSLWGYSASFVLHVESFSKEYLLIGSLTFILFTGSRENNHAERIFKIMPEKNAHSYCTMIRGMVKVKLFFSAGGFFSAFEISHCQRLFIFVFCSTGLILKLMTCT